MVYLHPALGAPAVTLLLWAGMQGLRARHRARYAGPARVFHRRLTPWMYGLVISAAVTGMASVAWLRDDLGEEANAHMVVGWTVAALLTVAAVTSKRLSVDARAKRLHPWLGLIAMLLGVVGALLGIRLLP